MNNKHIEIAYLCLVISFPVAYSIQILDIDKTCRLVNLNAVNTAVHCL